MQQKLNPEKEKEKKNSLSNKDKDKKIENSIELNSINNINENNNSSEEEKEETKNKNSNFNKKNTQLNSSSFTEIKILRKIFNENLEKNNKNFPAGPEPFRKSYAWPGYARKLRRAGTAERSTPAYPM